MKTLYVGQYSTGTTSKMRADQLNAILSPGCFHIIDTHVPFFKTNKIWRSFGFRLKKGILIKNVNKYITYQLEHIINNRNKDKYDLIWIDKGVFINTQTIKKLRQLTDKLVHYTPDMAFYDNYSKLFVDNINEYDYLITTKIAEKDNYLSRINSEKLIITTQGYDINTHKPSIPFNEKENSVTFVGLYESSREDIIKQLLDNNIQIKLAGKGWSNFVKNNKNNKYLQFYGESLVLNDYTQLISSSMFSLGLLSKKFPEYHTTRTFEIPACRTALITEKNEEIKTFFNDNEVIFFHSFDEMIEKISFYKNHLDKLEELTIKGNERVIQDNRNYQSILNSIITKIGLQ